MRKELITKDELIANLRENGMEEISEGKKAFVESEGNISFTKKKLLPKKKLIFKKTPPLFSWRGQYLV